MSDYPRIVQEIRQFLMDDDRTRNRRVEQIAAEYAAACAEVNERLGRCHELLRQGLRSEAIHLAEVEPLLDTAVSALDFPEREDWDDVVSIYSLPRALPLQIDLATELNQAYAEAEPLKNLLRRHRLMALNRDPLSARLKVLRRLAKLDFTTLFWAEDVDKFEQARLIEIKAEVNAASSSDDLPTLQALLAEVQQPEWVQPPSSSLKQGIQKLVVRCEALHAQSRLRKLEPELNTAHAEMNLGLAMELRRRWNVAALKAQLPPRDPLTESVQPVLDWLADEDRRAILDRDYQAAVQALDRALDDEELDPAELERLANVALRFDRGLPGALDRRYQTRTTAVQTSASRQHRMMMLGIGCGVVVTVAVVWAIMQAQVRGQRVRSLATILNQLIEEGHLDEARQQLQQQTELDPTLASMPGVMELETRLHAAEREEIDRQENFALAVAEADPKGGGSPNALKRAGELARTVDEKAQVVRLTRQQQQLVDMQRHQREKKLLDRLDELRPALQAIELQLTTSDDLDKSRSELLALRQQYGNLKQESAAVGPALAGQADALLGRLTALDGRVAELQKEVDAARQITQLVSRLQDHKATVNDYTRALTDYAGKHADTSRARDFKQASNEAETWEGALAWTELTSGWRSLKPGDRQEALLRLQACQTFHLTHGKAPDSAEAVEMAAVLQAVTHQTGATASSEETGEASATDSEGARDKLRKLFSDRLVGNLWMLDTVDRKRYYTTRQVRFGVTQSAQTISYLVKFDGDTKRRLLRKDDIVPGSIGLAPQSQLASQVQEFLRNMNSDNYDETAVKILELIRKSADLDPLLQLSLLRKTTQYLCEGSHYLKLELAEFLRRVTSDQVDLTVAWMDPDNGAAETARLSAKIVVRGLPDLSPVLMEVKKHHAELHGRISKGYRLAGWLARDTRGQWVCHSDHKPPAVPTTLCVIVPGTEGHGTWMPIGEVTRQQWKISQTHREALVEGRLVFVGEQR